MLRKPIVGAGKCSGKCIGSATGISNGIDNGNGNAIRKCNDTGSSNDYGNGKVVVMVGNGR